MTETVIADTGFWVALLFRRDLHHLQAAQAHRNHGGGLVSTWPILTEACYLLGRYVDQNAPSALLDLAEHAYQVWDLPSGGAAQAAALMRRYQDLPMDLADASAVLLAEHLGHGRILTTDRRDFAIYRWNGRRTFDHLLLTEP